MKKLLLLVITVLAIETTFAQGTEFEKTTFEQALAKAKKENKLLFMDCYTSWCAPCKILANNIFPKEEVGSLFNASFVNYKIDMESEEGMPLAKKYKVRVFPTLLWLDGDGEVKHKQLGAGTTKKLLDGAKLALDTENNWSGMQKRFLEGDHSIEFLLAYLQFGIKIRHDVSEASELYFAQKEMKELINDTDRALIMGIVRSSSDPLFQFMFENREQFYKIEREGGDLLYNTSRIISYFERVMKHDLVMAGKDSEQALTTKKKELIAMNAQMASKVAVYYDLDQINEDEEADKNKVYESILNYVTTYEKDNTSQLYKAIKSVSTKSANKKIMKEALELCEHYLDLDTNYFVFDLKVLALHHAGKEKEALKLAEKVIKMTPEDKMPSSVSALLLNKE